MLKEWQSNTVATLNSYFQSITPTLANHGSLWAHVQYVEEGWWSFP